MWQHAIYNLFAIEIDFTLKNRKGPTPKSSTPNSRRETTDILTKVSKADLQKLTYKS